MVVAAVTNAQISIMFGSKQNPFFSFFSMENLCKFIKILQIDQFIDFRDGILQVFKVTFYQTAGHDQFFAFTGYFVFCRFQDRLNGFFFGIDDKSAGVDNDHICLFQILCERITGFAGDSTENLAVHQVFGTTQTND